MSLYFAPFSFPQAWPVAPKALCWHHHASTLGKHCAGDERGLVFLEAWCLELKPNSSIFVSSDQRILFLTVWESFRRFFCCCDGCPGSFSHLRTGSLERSLYISVFPFLLICKKSKNPFSSVLLYNIINDLHCQCEVIYMLYCTKNIELQCVTKQMTRHSIRNDYWVKLSNKLS